MWSGAAGLGLGRCAAEKRGAGVAGSTRMHAEHPHSWVQTLGCSPAGRRRRRRRPRCRCLRSRRRTPGWPAQARRLWRGGGTSKGQGCDRLPERAQVGATTLLLRMTGLPGVLAAWAGRQGRTCRCPAAGQSRVRALTHQAAGAGFLEHDARRVAVRHLLQRKRPAGRHTQCARTCVTRVCCPPCYANAARMPCGLRHVSPHQEACASAWLQRRRPATRMAPDAASTPPALT